MFSVATQVLEFDCTNSPVEAKLLRMIGELKMSLLLIPVALMIFAAPLYCQAVDPARLKINNVVGLDSTYAQVLKLLGKPRKETKPEKEECTGGHEKTVDYEGLTFYFMDGPSRGHKTYLVMSFEVTSSRVTVSGVKLGDSEEVVRHRYGKPKSVDTDNSTGETTWSYEISERQGGPGQTTVKFKNGKVTAIGSSYTVC